VIPQAVRATVALNDAVLDELAQARARRPVGSVYGRIGDQSRQAPKSAAAHGE
jgi:hypothetical protein